MARLSDIKVKSKGGYRGRLIKTRTLIDKAVRLDIEDFRESASRLRDCDHRCDMQIRISGKLYVTWHSSDVLTQFLKDCREAEESEGLHYFPIESVKIVEQDDGSYTLADASDEPWLNDRVVESMCERRR